MAENLRQRKNCDNNKESGSNRNDIVGQNQSLLRRVRGWQASWLHLRSWWWYVESWDLQLCRRNCRDRSERNSQQRRNGLAGGSADSHGTQVRGDFGNGPAAPWIPAECVTRDIEKWLGKSVGDDQVGLIPGLQDRRVLRECFDQSHAERPDVGGSGERRGRNFGSVVRIKLAR